MAEPLWTIEERHLDHARRVADRYLVRTPLVPAPALGASVFLKLESEQHTGSFKVRGATARVAALTEEERARTVVAASAGNHGLGLAWAARVLGVVARVHVPRNAPLLKRQGMASLGAHVVVTEHEGYDDTEAEARADAEARGAVFVSPYDDPWVAAGNGGSVGLEILEGITGEATVVAPVGGGGLMAGLDAARRHLGREARLVGVQSEASPGMHRSLAEGRAIEHLAPVETLAEGLEGGVSPTSYALVRDAVQRVDLVGEQAIADAMRFAYRRLGITVEGSAATVIAWARDHADALSRSERPVVLVVTGRNVDEPTLRRIVS